MNEYTVEQLFDLPQSELAEVALHELLASVAQASDNDDLERFKGLARALSSYDVYEPFLTATVYKAGSLAVEWQSKHDITGRHQVSALNKDAARTVFEFLNYMSGERRCTTTMFAIVKVASYIFDALTPEYQDHCITLLRNLSDEDHRNAHPEVQRASYAAQLTLIARATQSSLIAPGTRKDSGRDEW